MKIIKSLFAFTSVFSMKSSNTTVSIVKAWPEIETYHELLLSLYNSAKKGDFVPIKNLANILNENAQKLSVENMPQNFRLPKNIEILVKLKRESCNIKELVENKAPNEEIFKSLESMHHIFKKMADFYKHKN
jgi:hypothetical protein